MTRLSTYCNLMSLTGQRHKSSHKRYHRPFKFPAHIRGCYELPMLLKLFSCSFKHPSSRLPLNGLSFSLSFQVHSFDQASISSLPTQDSFFLHVRSVIPSVILHFSIALGYCYSQCGTAGSHESSHLCCCRCSPHLMWLSGACTG